GGERLSTGLRYPPAAYGAAKPQSFTNSLPEHVIPNVGTRQGAYQHDSAPGRVGSFLFDGGVLWKRDDPQEIRLPGQRVQGSVSPAVPEETQQQPKLHVRVVESKRCENSVRVRVTGPAAQVESDLHLMKLKKPAQRLHAPLQLLLGCVKELRVN